MFTTTSFFVNNDRKLLFQRSYYQKTVLIWILSYEMSMKRFQEVYRILLLLKKGLVTLFLDHFIMKSVQKVDTIFPFFNLLCNSSHFDCPPLCLSPPAFHLFFIWLRSTCRKLLWLGYPIIKKNLSRPSLTWPAVRPSVGHISFTTLYQCTTVLFQHSSLIPYSQNTT